jgi:hypothetical protein
MGFWGVRVAARAQGAGQIGRLLAQARQGLALPRGRAHPSPQLARAPLSSSWP